MAASYLCLTCARAMETQPDCLEATCYFDMELSRRRRGKISERVPRTQETEAAMTRFAEIDSETIQWRAALAFSASDEL